MMEISGDSGECCRGVHVRGFVRMYECGSAGGACCRFRGWTVRHLWACAIATCLPFFVLTQLMSLPVSARLALLRLLSSRGVCASYFEFVLYMLLVSVLQLLLQMQLAELEGQPCVRVAHAGVDSL
jgi:hypothetical protein